MAVMPPMKINIEFPFPALRVEVREGSWNHTENEYGPSTGLVMAGDVVLFTAEVPSWITQSWKIGEDERQEILVNEAHWVATKFGEWFRDTLGSSVGE